MHISEFQDMMKRIYLHRDLERGTDRTFKWLVSEIEELETTIRMQNRKAMLDEFADVLAWLASLANVVEIDLEKAATSKYYDKCPKCQKSPCQCPFSNKH